MLNRQQLLRYLFVNSLAGQSSPSVDEKIRDENASGALVSGAVATGTWRTQSPTERWKYTPLLTHGKRRWIPCSQRMLS